MILLVLISNFAPTLIILTVSLFLKALVGAYGKTKGSMNELLNNKEALAFSQTSRGISEGLKWLMEGCCSVYQGNNYLGAVAAYAG